MNNFKARIDLGTKQRFYTQRTTRQSVECYYDGQPNPVIIFTLTEDGKRYKTPHGRVTIRKYEGFDFNDIAHDPKVASTNEAVIELVVQKEREILDARLDKISYLVIEQGMCDAYVNIVEIAKINLTKMAAHHLIIQMKKLRYYFYVQLMALMEFLLPSVEAIRKAVCPNLKLPAKNQCN